MKPYEPIREIKFAARSGFLTRELCDNYFTSGSIDWKKRLWIRLLSREYFKNHYSKRAADVLVLNRRNDLVKKLVGEDIVSPPFISQLDHDEIVAKFVLATLKGKTSSGYKFEIELKKESPALRRHYGSDQKQKFPDAILQLCDHKKTKIALELELTNKDPKRYRNIMEAYSSMGNVAKVIFITRNDRLWSTIKQAMRDSYYLNSGRPVGFSRLDDWLKNPNEAPIFFDDEITSLAKMTMKDVKASS